MHNSPVSRLRGLVEASKQVTGMVFVIILFISTGTVFGQGELGSGTVSGSGSGPFTYSLSFSDAPNATAPIGSIWYAWVPGLFFLPSTPASASAPSGWTATISGNSIQYTANSSASYINPGESLAGFGFEALFSPEELAAAQNSGLSVAYSGGLFSDAGDTFSVVPAVPEPSPVVFITAGAYGLVLLAKRRKLFARVAS